MKQSVWSKTCAAAAISALVLPSFGMAQQSALTVVQPSVISKPLIEVGPRSSDEVFRQTLNPATEPVLTEIQKKNLVRQKIKYVFVLFQENRSFDFYFGTFPGANGLFSQPASQTPGFNQPIVLTSGNVGTISPFKIPQSVTNTSGASVLLYPEDTDSVNHGHTAIDAKLDLNAHHIPQNDRYAFVEQGLKGTLSADGKTYTGPAPTEQQVQKGELVMGHVDCDTAPFLWNYADRFTLFDNFFDTVIGPSTPNAIAMIAGQSGETQWVKHPELASNVNTTNAQLPVTADPQPFWGSSLDFLTPPSEKQPVDNPGGVSSNPASNLTFATLPLSFMGKNIQSITAQDYNPTFDLQDVQEDISKIASDNIPQTPWGWFQEGYDHEPTDPTGTVTNYDYIAHHNGPQYFGYEANNPVETKAHMKGLGDFYTAIKNNALPAQGGVFYVRGGYGNIDGLVPRSPSPAVKAAYQGNDDHPGYSDAQISEALLADSINAIASSPYWPESAIIITYDESDGLFDHTQPVVRSYDPLGNALDQGPRIPTIVISPYASAHAIVHEAAEHSSIIKFIDGLYNYTALADLPDEAAAIALGQEKYNQKYLGPGDAHVPGVSDLLIAFDNARLLGTAAPLPASYALIPAAQVTTLPHAGAQGCRALQITPTDLVNGVVIDPAPADFNPRPSTNPGLPTSGTWPSN
jgi:phospholipase C